jgi:hypothetical protein
MILLTFKAPSRPLSENESRRLHWASRKRRLQDWGTLTQVAWKHADQKDKQTIEDQKVQIRVTLPFPRKARRDPHNYVGTNVKCIIDALVRAGAFEDDTPDYVEVLEPRLSIDPTDEVHIAIIPIGRNTRRKTAQ